MQEEEKLRQYKCILSSLPDKVALLDENYRYMIVNRAYESLPDFDQEWFIGKTIAECLGEDTFLKNSKPYFDQCLKGKVVNFQYSGTYPSGETRFHKMTYLPYKDSDNRISGVISITQEITEKVKMEESLQEVFLRQQEAIKDSGIGLWEWDCTTNKIIFPSEWKRQIGYGEHEIGDNFEEWQSRVHPDDLKQTLEKVWHSIETDQKEHWAEFRFRHKNGAYLWILTHGSVILDETGRPVRMLGSHIDITR